MSIASQEHQLFNADFSREKGKNQLEQGQEDDRVLSHCSLPRNP
jgi:hypothetical protein